MVDNSASGIQVSALLDAALHYGALGQKVVPLHTPADPCSCGNPECSRPGKHPRIKDWLNQASSDPKQIRKWWAKWPDANIGILTGRPSNIWVLDIEARAVETLESLEEKHGPLSPIRVRSGGGGIHLYFKVGASPVPSQLDWRSSIDVLSDGRLVVAPPSLHASGRRYEWL